MHSGHHVGPVSIERRRMEAANPEMQRAFGRGAATAVLLRAGVLTRGRLIDRPQPVVVLVGKGVAQDLAVAVGWAGMDIEKIEHVAQGVEDAVKRLGDSFTDPQSLLRLPEEI